MVAHIPPAASSSFPGPTILWRGVRILRRSDASQPDCTRRSDSEQYYPVHLLHSMGMVPAILRQTLNPRLDQDRLRGFMNRTPWFLLRRRKCQSRVPSTLENPDKAAVSLGK